MEDSAKKPTCIECLKHGCGLWRKPMRMFPLHFVCVYLVVLAPIVLHHAYACLIGPDSIFLRGNFTFGFFSDVLEFCFLLMGWGEYAATAVRASRLALCAVSLGSTAFAWCLCAHVAASCLVGTQPSFKHSLRVASRAFSRVASTAVAAVVPFIVVIFSVLAVCLAVFLTYTGAEAPWIPRLESATEKFMEKNFAVLVSLAVFVNLVVVAVAFLVSSTFSLTLVAAAVRRDSYGFSALRESAKLSRGLFPFLVCTVVINWTSVNYVEFAEAVKHQNVGGILCEVLFVSFVVFFKVLTIFFICIVYFHSRTVPVDRDDVDGKKEWFTAKLSKNAFEADNKSLIYDIVADFDDSMTDETSSFLLQGIGKI